MKPRQDNSESSHIFMHFWWCQYANGRFWSDELRASLCYIAHTKRWMTELSTFTYTHTQPNSRGFWDHRRISTSIDCTAKNELYRAQFSINIMYNVPSFKHYGAMNNTYPWWLWACRIGSTLLYPLNLSCSTVFTQKSHCFEFHVSMVERLYHYNLSFYINMIVVVHR